MCVTTACGRKKQGVLVDPRVTARQWEGAAGWSAQGSGWSTGPPGLWAVPSLSSTGQRGEAGAAEGALAVGAAGGLGQLTVSRVGRQVGRRG